MRKLIAILAVIAAVLLLTSISISANGLQYYDTFNASFEQDWNITSGGGTGYNGGEWFYYPQSELTTQWFYNGPFDPDRWKRVWGSVSIDPLDVNYYVEFAINWATPVWDPSDPTGGSAPPLPEDIVGALEEDFIAHQSLFSFDEQNPVPGSPIDFYFEILDFNPEWISVDFYGMNVAVCGEIWHECVPEPTTFALLGIGGLAVLIRKRKNVKS
ncbi:MAG: PEP-CTERM sorting domain-containing protein [Planctomycetes bacterium]|nr:PEP-CTERM sorting domain-containing protein [Planctomycetota bacterium]